MVKKIENIRADGTTGATDIIEAVNLTYSTFLADPRFGIPGYRFAAIFITDGAHNDPQLADALTAIHEAILPMLVVGNNIATMSIGKVIYLYNLSGFLVQLFKVYMQM